MTNYPDDELEAMLADLVERMETFQRSATIAVGEAICAFANDLPAHRRAGGVFVDAWDDSSRAGLVVSDALRNLADVETNDDHLPIKPPLDALTKSTNYPPNVLIQMEAQEAGLDNSAVVSSDSSR